MILCLAFAMTFRGIGSIGMVLAAISFAGALPKGIADYRTPVEKTGEKSREFALMLSMFAGAGHTYLNRAKTGCPVLILFIISVIGSGYGFFTVIEASIESIDAGMIVFSYSIVSTMTLSVWSLLSVNDLCNKMNIPRSGSMYEIKWKNTKRGIRILSIFSFTLILLISTAFVYYNLLGLTIGIPIILISTALFILSFPYSNKFTSAFES